MSSRKDVTFYFLGKDTPSGTPMGAPHSRDMTATGSHNHFYSLRGAHPPGEGLTQKYRAGSSEESPLLLTEGGTAQAVTGVEGTRCVLSDCSEI